jgi:aldose 1-epimerase
MISTSSPISHPLPAISDGVGTVEIAPHIGGAIASYRWDIDGKAVDWLRPASVSAIADGEAGAMGCFPLVPYSNRIENSRFNFDGRTVNLPGSIPADPHFEHGHGWRHAWSVVRHEANRIVLRYRHAADAWPWDYEAEQAISLAEGNLTVTLMVRNLSQEPMPMGFGLHPYFPATPTTRIVTSVEGMWETDSEVLPTQLVSAPPAADPSAGLVTSSIELDTVFTRWSHQARIEWPETNRALIMQAGAPLDFLTLYTPANEPYFCAEPVSNVTNAFNLSAHRSDTGQIILGPSANITASVRFMPTIHQ